VRWRGVREPAVKVGLGAVREGDPVLGEGRGTTRSRRVVSEHYNSTQPWTTKPGAFASPDQSRLGNRTPDLRITSVSSARWWSMVRAVQCWIPASESTVSEG
jgi:hypothetical protein